MASWLHCSYASVIKTRRTTLPVTNKHRAHASEPAPMCSYETDEKIMLSPSRICLAIAVAMTLAVPVSLFGQNVKPKSGIIIGTVIDANGDPVPNATVELKSLE